MSVDHYENFPVASVLLPKHLRRPVEWIYRFARNADDFADEGEMPAQARLAHLAAYHEALDRAAQGAPTRDPLFVALGEIIREYQLPLALFHDLLSAFEQDVIKKRYANFTEVLDYCRRSANPVGRLLLHLYQHTNEASLAQSDHICSALQLINFWQDVAVDYKKDRRIYLPQDEMQRYNVSEQQIAEGETDDAWRALMYFQIDRARAMLFAGAPLATALPGRIGLELRMIVAGGARILEKLDAVQGDVFSHRPVLRVFDTPLMLTRALLTYNAYTQLQTA